MYLRGTVWEYAFEVGAAPKPAVVVSNNGRNRSQWPYVHVVRVTTAPKQPRETIVELAADEGIVGRVLCDEVAPVPKAALGRQVGALSPGAMRRIDAALELVLGLS